MSKVVPLDPEFNFPAVTSWEKTYPPKYYVEPHIVQVKGVLNKTFRPDLSYMLNTMSGVQAFIVAKSDPYGTLFGDSNLNRIHINSFAYSQEEQGRELLNHFLEQVPENQPIVFGQDQGHFFPGVPEECPHIIALLEEFGFEKTGHLANDLEHDLRLFNPDPTWLEPLNASDLQVRNCTMLDVPALDEFFRREFPGRWHYDTVIEKCNTWREPHEIIALWQGDTIEGFAYTQSYKTTKIPTAGFLWKKDLGEYAGALGPIGVSKRVRGRKLGGALLVAGLNHLKSLGVQQCIIDWTSLIEFYGKYGFRVNRRYQPMTRPPI